VRVAHQTLRCLGDEAHPAGQSRLNPLPGMLERFGLAARTEASSGGREAVQKEVLALLFHEERPDGLRALLKRIHAAAFSVRGVLLGSGDHTLSVAVDVVPLDAAAGEAEP